MSIGDFRPTEQDIAVKDELTKLIDEQLAKYKTIVETDIPALNKAIKAKEVDAIFID